MGARIFLSGCQGRMGRVIGEIAANTSDLTLVAGSDLKTGPSAWPVYADPRDCREEFDVLIDFSNPSALPALFGLIRDRRCPSVICTTGLDAALSEELRLLAAVVPLFQSANMSLGINLLVSLVRQSARLLYPDFDIEIIEAHHNQKLDAPSGTALMIAGQINEALAGQMTFVADRSKVRQKRGQQEIGIHAVRGGSIVGEHTVLFAGQDELISIHHSALSRSIFARGALAAARFILNKPAGLYSMKDLIG
jgi:4-hydroxy-tetrahydrodipicolinate reductase